MLLLKHDGEEMMKLETTGRAWRLNSTTTQAANIVKFPGLQTTAAGYEFVCKVCGTLILSAVPPGEVKCAWCAWLVKLGNGEG